MKVDIAVVEKWRALKQMHCAAFGDQSPKHMCLNTAQGMAQPVAFLSENSEHMVSYVCAQDYWQQRKVLFTNAQTYSYNHHMICL
jgi:hypothetical protein